MTLDTYEPSAYFNSGYNWEKLEPLPQPIATPTSDIDSIQEPMDVEFEQIWCPVIVDSMQEAVHEV